MSSQDTEPIHRRKANKRRVDSDEEGDEDGDSDPLNISPGKGHPLARRKRIAKALQDPLPTDLEIQPRDVAETPSQSLSKARGPTTPTARPQKPIAEGKRAGRPKKKRIVVESGEEDENGLLDDAPDSPYRPQHDRDEDDEYVQEPGRSDTPMKQKTLVRRRMTRSGNTDPVAKGKRGKAKKETKEITAKNEGDSSNAVQGPSQVQGNPATTSGRSRPADDSKAADSIPDLSTSETSKVRAPETAEVVTPPQPTKRKLPTIKKTKAPVTTSPALPNSATGPPLVDAGEVSQLPAMDSRVVAANVGSADFDLRKPSVYAELFKSAGGSTPRSGLNRREKDEERRRELKRMKEEARAKNTAETKQVFDLQAQWDKISRFEERLRQEKSSVLFPNFLAAKFKDDWERQRRKDVDKARTNKIHLRDNRSKD